MNKRVRIYRFCLCVFFVFCCIFTCFYMANNNFFERKNEKRSIDGISTVNADSPLFPDRSYGRRFINNGSLNPLDINGFNDKSLIFRELGPNVGMDPVVTDMEFLCYANPVTEEAFGCPLTRLVIEGKILGKTWYWPIDLCKLQENGIQAGEDYEISLTILRTGTDDPDTPVRLVGGELEMEIVQWKEKENQPIYF